MLISRGMGNRGVPASAMRGAGALSLAFIVLLVTTVTMPANGALPQAQAESPVAQVQSVDAAGHNGGYYNASSFTGQKDGGGGGGGGGGSSGGTSWGYGWGWGWGWGTNGGGGGGGGGSGGGGGGGGTREEQHEHDDGRATTAASSRGKRRARRHQHRHRPSYSSRLYRVGEYARCTAGGRCGGMRLLCPMHCDGPCFYDCDANCKAHCRF